MILRKHIFILLLLLASCFGANAQRFFNLASSQVEVDSVLPEFTYAIPLYNNYDDSLYNVRYDSQRHRQLRAIVE